MKKFIILLITTLAILSSSLFADDDVMGAIDERKVDIYFGNGVWNTWEQAEESRKKLDIKIKQTITQNNPKLAKKYGEVKLQYNWGRGQMDDLLETYYQLKEAGQVNNLEFFALMEVLTRGNHALSSATTLALLSKMPYTAEVEETNINQMLAKYYLESFVYSHRVLLVSHSQGNLFANRVYKSLDPKGYQNYFANVQVGSPAGKIEAKMGDYITNKGDLIINPIPYSMKANATPDAENNVLPECLDALSTFDMKQVVEVCKNTPDNHQFIPYYLGQQDPYTKIISAIKKQLENLDKTDSQWKIKSEIKKDTKDYRVKVEHKFDSAFDYSVTNIDNEEVFPFNTKNGKIYQVPDISGTPHYVKASAGGERILESWDGQNEDNQFYKLEGTKPVEYIEKRGGKLVGKTILKTIYYGEIDTNSTVYAYSRAGNYYPLKLLDKYEWMNQIQYNYKNAVRDQNGNCVYEIASGNIYADFFIGNLDKKDYFGSYTYHDTATLINILRNYYEIPNTIKKERIDTNLDDLLQRYKDEGIEITRIEYIVGEKEDSDYKPTLTLSTNFTLDTWVSPGGCIDYNTNKTLWTESKPWVYDEWDAYNKVIINYSKNSKMQVVTIKLYSN